MRTGEISYLGFTCETDSKFKTSDLDPNFACHTIIISMSMGNSGINRAVMYETWA